MEDCKVYFLKGEIVRTVQPKGKVPLLKSGDNEVRFETGINRPVNVRANVTVISEDQKTFGNRKTKQ